MAIIDNGGIIALGSPRELVHGLGAEKKITFSLDEELEASLMQAVPGVSRVERQNGETVLYTSRPQTTLLHILSQPPAKDLILKELRVSDANLEDVFLNLTGRKLI